MMHGRPLKQTQPSLDVTRINPEICIVPMHSCDLVSNPFTIYGVDEGGLGFFHVMGIDVFVFADSLLGYLL